MLTSEDLLQADAGAAPGRDFSQLHADFSRRLTQAFGTTPTILDGLTGDVLTKAPDQPAWDWELHAELCREVARRGWPEFIGDEDPFLVLAMPLVMPENRCHVAVATFVSRQVSFDEDLCGPARLLGIPVADAAAWASRQTPWPADTLMRIAELVVTQSNSDWRVRALEAEVADLSGNLSSSYEEISLLYHLTQNLKISQSDEQLVQIALDWLKEVVPASAMAAQLIPVGERDPSLSHGARRDSTLLTSGDSPVDNREFAILVEHVDPVAAKKPVVINPPATSRDDWPNRKVRQIIVVPLAEGENLFGYLAALNHVEDGEFGTIEASLLSSVAAILGIHGGNIELYRQQSELMAGIIRALTSAIDAKDPYTRGHSDRVAQIAVKLAEQLGCDAKQLHTIYLSGLLHDIGKIGIDDRVLRKPGRLSDEEFLHIKRHPEIGHKILSDLGKLDDVLPVILYHHESWDGGGYPSRLGAKQIPLSARIVAVADSFDAMGSDRPYRKKMPDEKIDAIFRSGAGKQWDADVVNALFRIRDDIRKIALSEQESANVGPN